jgi:hypothetical protein
MSHFGSLVDTQLKNVIMNNARHHHTISSVVNTPHECEINDPQNHYDRDDDNVFKP